MHVIEIFLPLYDNEGRRFGRELYHRVRQELAERFGGLTAFSRSPAEGLWVDDGETSRDDIIIFEVIAEELERGWWSQYRRQLEQRFAQELILIRASEATQL